MAKRPNDFDAFFANTPDGFKPVVTELRKLVGRIAPNLVEQMKYGMPSYTKCRGRTSNVTHFVQKQWYQPTG